MMMGRTDLIREYECPAELTLDLIGGKWKILIIWELREMRRFAELERMLPGVTRKVLVQQLRQLEEDLLITRTVYPEVPPRVEYRLTESGQQMLEIFGHLADWAVEHSKSLNRRLTGQC